MEIQNTLDFGQAVIGVDPASRVVGVCLMRGDGQSLGTWSIKAAGPPLQRLYSMYEGVRELFDKLPAIAGSRPELYIEEGIFGGQDWTKSHRANQPKIAGSAGEVRGMILSEAWRHGWKTRKMFVQSWKALIPKEIRKMKKDKAYVVFWNERLGLKARSPDEIDSYFISKRALQGR